MKKNLRYFMTLLLMMVASVGWAVDTWVKTDITSLATGDVVAIVDVSSSRAMANDKGTGSAPTAISVTLSEDKTNITSVVPNSLQWVLTVDDDSYSFGVGTTFLYCTSSNNGVRVGTNDNKVFAWQKDANSTFNNKDNFLYNKATGRYLGVYSDSDWRCYTSVNSNIQKTTTAFYKKVEGTETFCAIPTFTPEANTYTTTQTVEIACTTNGATIHYTTDGSEPTAESATYTNAIEVSTSTTIKAIAVKDGLDNSSVATGIFTIFGGVNATDVGSRYYEKVTDVSTLANGDAILIVNEEYAKALSTTQNETYRGEANVTINANTIDDPATEVQKLVLAGEDGAWFLSVGGENSFLYSPEYGNNLETTGTVSDAARATITITDGNAEIRFNGSNTANLISYNYNKGTNSRFSCYATPQSPVQIYKEVVKPNKEEPGLAYGTTSYEITYGNEFTTPELTNPNELTVAYASSEEGVATVDASTGAVTIKGVGTTTITASFAGNESFLAGSASYTLTVNADPNASGGVNNPYTVAQARDSIDAGTGITGVYAKGIVSEIVTAYNSQYGNISYNISADGLTTSAQLQAFRGKSYDGNKFTSADDIQVGDTVVIYGNLTKYKSTYEFEADNQLVSLNRPDTPTITVTPTDVEADATETKGRLMVTYTEINTPEVLFYAADGTSTATYDWIVAKLNSDNNVDYIISANTGEARTAYLKVHGLDADANDVYSDLITISQAAYVAPGTGYCYKKVTSTADITDGEYLIVYEEESVAFNGGLKTLDAASNTVAVTISDYMIDATEATNAATFTINTTEGSIKSASGMYIGVSSNSNGLKQTDNSSTYTHEFSIDEEGNAVIAALFDKSTMTLRYNKASDQKRFRYFKSGQQAIQLYKKVETESVPVNEYGKGTYVTKKALDFTGITTVTAYVATAQSGSDVTFDPVTTVPAGTPLLVKGATTNVPVIASAEEIGTNFLVAGSGEGVTSVAGGKYNFILNYLNGAVGFYRAAGMTVAADRAYLSLDSDIPAGSAKVNLIFSDEESTGINNVNAVENTNEKVFNLAGQQMKSAVKGVYIKNGRKYVK